MLQLSRRRMGLAGVLTLVVLVAFAWGPVMRYRRAADFLTTLSELGKAETSPGRVSTEEVTIPGAAGKIRARLYFLSDRPRGTGLVVAHGVHHQGIDERRLVPFARGLAEQGLVVLTPEITDLADYRITVSGVGIISEAVSYLASRRDHVTSERVGILGFSFAGGLALVASASPELHGKLSSVTSVGGHQELSRVLHFLIHDEIKTPTGVQHEKAHDYGLVVLLYGNLERFVPATDLPVMRAAFKAWLEEDFPRARAEATRRTTPEAKRLWSLLEKGQLQTLAPELDALLATQAEQLSALSPAGRLHQIDAPVFLLHGAHDSVIPPSETSWGDRELGTAPHGALVSPLLEHVEVSGAAGLREKVRLLDFMAHLF
jgi:dienelactone hydrolase